jgi:hypothetical protein
MSGREETSEPVEVPGTESKVSPGAAAPPSFGNAAPPQSPPPQSPPEPAAEPAPTEFASAPAEPGGSGQWEPLSGPAQFQNLGDFGTAAVPHGAYAAPEPAQEPATPASDHLDGPPKAPWWETAPMDADADPSPAGTPVEAGIPAGTPVETPVAGRPGPRFSDTEPTGIPVLTPEEPTAVPGEAFGGPTANVATAAGMTPPPEAAPVFDLTAPGNGAPRTWETAPRPGYERPTGGGAGMPVPGIPVPGGEAPLIPDAILPPGTVPGQPGTIPGQPADAPGTASTTLPTMAPPQGQPPQGQAPQGPQNLRGPGQNGATQAPTPVFTPTHHADGGLPPHGVPPAPPRTGGRPGGRRPLLIGGGVAAAALVAALAFAGVKAMSGSSDESPAQPTASAQSRPPARAGKTPPTTSIDSEKTDRRPLSLSEVFPNTKIMISGRPYKQDKTSVNHQCGLAARGAMATALDRGRCRSVVRATYVDGKKKYAVTTGVAVMPTRAAALTVSKAGDPSGYEWFRGMRGKVATKIDQAGGYASSTVRGRYIVYSYAQYADGTRPQPTDPVLKNLTRQFIAYAVRPIDRRAQ